MAWTKILHVFGRMHVCETVFRSGMKALESLEFLHMDAFFVPSRGTLSCDAGKNKEIHAYVAHLVEDGPGEK